MKNTKLAIVLMMSMFLISFASAIDCIPHLQKDNLSFSFSDNIAISCNVSTITYPDGVIYINQEMNKTGNTFTSIILGNNFTTFGTYIINMDCEDGYGNICREVNEYGISTNSFMLYTLFYVLLLFVSYLLIYKVATFNGGKLKDYNFYFWAGFLDLILYVLIEVNGFGGAETLIVDIIKILSFASGAYFLVQGMVYASSFKKSIYK